MREKDLVYHVLVENAVYFLRLTSYLILSYTVNSTEGFLPLKADTDKYITVS